MATIRATYENGVFRPSAPVNLPDGAIVSFELIEEGSPEDKAHRERLHAILSHSYETGDPFAAERHNERQP